MVNDCFIEKIKGVIENENLRHFNSFRLYIPNGTTNSRFLAIYPTETVTCNYWSNKNIFQVDGSPSKKSEVQDVTEANGAVIYPSNAISGFVFVDVSPLDKMEKISIVEGGTGNCNINIDDFINSNIQEMTLPYNSYENGDFISLGYMPELTSFVSSRSKYSGSVESVVEKTVENYPTKEKSLVINLYAQADFGGTVTFHGSTLSVALYIEFNGDGTANVYNNTDHSTVIASYNGTTWTYA